MPTSTVPVPEPASTWFAERPVSHFLTQTEKALPAFLRSGALRRVLQTGGAALTKDEGGQRILRIHESQNYKGFDGKLDGVRGARFKRFLKAIGQILPTETGCRPAATPGHPFERSTPNDRDSAEKSPPRTIAVALEEQIGAPPSVVASGRGKDS